MVAADGKAAAAAKRAEEFELKVAKLEDELQEGARKATRLSNEVTSLKDVKQNCQVRVQRNGGLCAFSRPS